MVGAAKEEEEKKLLVKIDFGGDSRSPVPREGDPLQGFA